MYTHCPHCRTTFRIHPDQLAQARGQVRCGVCSYCFNALDSLTEHLAPPPPQPAPLPEPEAPPATPEPEAELAASAIPEPEAEPVSSEIAAEAPVPEAITAEEAAGALEQADTTGEVTEEHAVPAVTAGAPAEAVDEIGRTEAAEPQYAPAREELQDLGPIAAEPRPVPEGEAEQERPPQAWKTALWAAANVLLILVLAGQYLYYNRQELAQYPELRPWVSQLCAALDCEIPLQRDVQRIALTSRLVESHPSRANALLIEATLVNQAAFAQPYPLLELRFSDLNNQLVAGRRFRPSEYLPPETDLPAGMPSNQPVHIRLEIADPGKEAVSFQFELL